MLQRFPWSILLAVLLSVHASADWPTVRGNPARTGLAETMLDSRSRLAWRTALVNAPTSTCVEPIVARGRVFVATLSGDVIALDANDGHVLWRERVGGPVLHSPAWAPDASDAGRLYVASVDGGLTCLDAASGKRLWRYAAGAGGFAASPAVVDRVIYIGARNGTFHAVLDAGSKPTLAWARDLGAPIWQTAAVLDPETYPERSGVFVMAEDMVARCLDPGDGTVLWQSTPVGGSSARNYYPVVAGDWVLFSTRPADGAETVMDAANRALTAASELDRVDTAEAVEELRRRTETAREQWKRRELYDVGVFLEQHPRYQTLWAFRAEDGQPGRTPVLWGAGCGGVMSPPAVSPEGRPIVFWRSWYNGWMYGNRYAYASASPFRGVGYLDPETGMLETLLPENVASLPFGVNTTIADETSALQVAGGRLLGVHQGSVTSLNLHGGPLRVIYGHRDTWMGAPNAPWQGNEWHGPGRGGLAVSDGRAYMVCGGYVLCLAMDGQGIANNMPDPVDERVDTDIEAEPLDLDALEPVLAPPPGPVVPVPAAGPLVDKLTLHVKQYLDDGPYAPRRVVLGKSGVYLDFAQSAAEITALARAYPYLPTDVQKRTREHLLKLLREHPPWQEEVTGAGAGTPTSMLPPYAGRHRERWLRPDDLGGHREPPLGIAGLYGVWLLGERADAWDALAKAWPSIKLSLDAPSLRYFEIGLDVPENPRRHRRGHWAMNRTVNGLIAYIRMADAFEDTIAARKARQRLAEILGQFEAFWSELKIFPDAKYFAGVTPARGNVLLLMSNAVVRPRTPHCWSVAQLANLRPEGLRFLAADPTRRQNVLRLLEAIENVGPAWYVTDANRYIHFGENHTMIPGDTPGIMRAMAAFRPEQTGADVLMQYVDLPACEGDWHYVERLVTAIEEISRPSGSGQ